MDLRAYYKKVREVESGMTTPYVVVVSHETPDGGKPDVMSEVAKHAGAQQIASGHARLATEQEARRFHTANQEAKQIADDNASLNRMQLVVVPSKVSGRAVKEQA